RLRGSTVTANAVHPGVVSTSFGAEDPGQTQRLLVPLLRPFMKDTRRGAATSIHVASSAQLRGVTGQYFSHSRTRRSSARSRDPDTAARLWQASARLLGA
ncbi:MAG TPA: short-chain dehydrogenase, partial [Intrasporangium sp.]|nr:short-chain dehydrogenase [Intrasporangium sp.]